MPPLIATVQTQETLPPGALANGRIVLSASVGSPVTITNGDVRSALTIADAIEISGGSTVSQDVVIGPSAPLGGLAGWRNLWGSNARTDGVVLPAGTQAEDVTDEIRAEPMARFQPATPPASGCTSSVWYVGGVTTIPDGASTANGDPVTDLDPRAGSIVICVGALQVASGSTLSFNVPAMVYLTSSAAHPLVYTDTGVRAIHNAGRIQGPDSSATAPDRGLILNITRPLGSAEQDYDWLGNLRASVYAPGSQVNTGWLWSGAG